MVWMLVFIWVIGSSVGVQDTHVSFNAKEDCERYIKRHSPDFDPHRYDGAVFVCVPRKK